jgi:apolipoprotein N-acyltransferase
MPSTSWWWAFFISLPLFLIRFESEATFREAFLASWSFGFGYFCVALHWIGFAFLVDAKTYLWMMPFAVGGLAAVMAIYWGIAGLTARLMSRIMTPLFGFPITLSVCEWLRGHLMTGFPWAVPGLAVDGMGPVAQLASVTGMTGLTLLILLWAATPAVFIAGAHRSTRASLSILLLALPAAYFWGSSRLASHPPSFVDGFDLRVVQPNLSQDEKWRAENASRSFDELVTLSTSPASGFNIKLIVWPESAVSFLIDESDEAKAVLRDALADEQVLLTGSLRRLQTDRETFFTSIVAFDSEANIIGVYDKWRLVPGGEFLPFASILEPLGFQRVVSLPGGFTAGPGPGAIDLPGLGRFGMLICYEAAFPHDLVAAGPRPTGFVNVTNDGWFGSSTGPYQHLAQVRLRAIEQGIPIVRSANTGISTVFDAFGRDQGQLNLNQSGFLDAHLPVALPAPFYARHGDLLFGGLVLLAAVVGSATRRT